MSQQINLFNENLHKSGNDFAVLNMLQALGVILFCATLFYTYVTYQTRQLEQQLEQAANKLATEQSRLAEMAAEYARQRAGLSIEQELQKLTAEAAAQSTIISALKHGVIGSTKGYSEYMQAFARQSVNGMWLTGFSIEADAAQLSLRGAALSPDLVPSYILRLNKEAVMRGKIFSSLNMQLPKVGETKQAAQHLEFVLQSAAVSDMDNNGEGKR